MSHPILLIRDLPSLRHKLDHPPPLLARLLARFNERLRRDGEFRRHHIFLPALLGDPVAIAEAKGHILTLALNPLILAQNQSPGSKATAQNSLDAHIWCMAPRVMRLAVTFTWLDSQGAWTAAERRIVGTGILDFFYDYVIPVLRARVPGGHNQQFSMTFCSTVAGHAFADVEGVSARARALRDWAFPKFRQVLGLMAPSGYTGEGSTYQSDVVSGLVMWAGVFLEQQGERGVWDRQWEPNGWRLSDTLRMETAMGSCGGWLPPWDHYGWAPIHNLAARTLWANLSGDPQILQVAESAWETPHQLAWYPDDRLWTLLYWPAHEGAGSGGHDPRPDETRSPLTGWSLPAVGAAVEHQPRRLRVLMVWDRCADGVQGISREQVNPNHLMIDLGGEPITGDGPHDSRVRYFPDAALARTRSALSVVEIELIAQQYGSFDAWINGSQQGFLGSACAILVDGWDGYFPPHAREGRLLFERRETDRHTVSGEASAYYQPAFDVSRMRRTVSVGASGVTWVVDDLQAPTAHTFTWRMWFRRGARQVEPLGVRLDLPSGVGVTLAWLAGADGAEPLGPISLTTVPTFPLGRGWPDEGSVRTDLSATGRRVCFITCLVPDAVEGLSLRRIADGQWEAIWTGGSDRFTLPPEIGALPDAEPVAGKQTTDVVHVCDLDDEPFALLEDPDAALLAALDDPPVGEWRRTGAVMQTLVARGNRDALPKIITLLLDGRQNYTVHAVAAWCLGRARHRPAIEALRRLTHIPEVNTAARARWALERMSQEPPEHAG
ncbi:MAG: hypothetical protein FJ222_08165 [Lentisphaerae bacterium]|nr:hypothetical protein [Lentisphaerota bacterium]